MLHGLIILKKTVFVFFMNSNIQKSQNIFVNWEELGSTALGQYSESPNFKSMEELGKCMFTVESKISNFYNIRLFKFQI